MVWPLWNIIKQIRAPVGPEYVAKLHYSVFQKGKSQTQAVEQDHWRQGGDTSRGILNPQQHTYKVDQ